MSTEPLHGISEGNKYLFDNVIIHMDTRCFEKETKEIEKQRIMNHSLDELSKMSETNLLRERANHPEIWEKYKKLVETVQKMDVKDFQGLPSALIKMDKVQKIFTACQKYNVPYSTYEAFMDECTQQGKKPFIHAVINKNFKIIKVLHELGNAINEMNQEGETPLTQAISSGDIKMVKLLIELGANVNQASSQGMTPMSIAVDNENRGARYAMVKYLHAGGAELDLPSKNGWTPMASAARKGYTDTMLLLYNLNTQDVNNGKAFPINLMGPMKVSGVLKSLPDLLIEHQQDSAAKLLKRWNAEQKYGLENLYHNILELVKQEDSAEKQVAVNEAIRKFIRMPDAYLIQEVVEHIPIWEQFKQLIETLPQGVDEAPQSSLMKKLLEKQEKTQQTISSIFMIRPIQKVIEICAEHDIAFVDYFMFMYECMDKNMPVMQAVMTKNMKMIQVLAALGFDMNRVDEEEGYTPLIYAIENGNVEIVKLLCELHIDIDQTGNGKYERMTPIIMAVINEKNINMKANKEIILCLLTYGAELDRADKNGWTLMAAAARANDTDTMHLLRELSVSYHQPINLNYLYKSVPLLSWLIMHSGETAAVDLLKTWGADHNALDIIKRKRLAHVWGLDGDSTAIIGKEEITFPLEYMEREYGAKMLCEYVNDFLDSIGSKMHNHDKEIIKEAVATAFPLLVEDDDKIISKIKLGKPVVFFSGSEDHTVSVVIKGNQLAVFNRGEGGEKDSIEFYSIHESYIDKEINEIIQCLKKCHPDMDSFKNAIKFLKLKLNPLSVLQKDQEVGNCSWASAKGVFGILCMFLKNNDVSVMKEIYKEFTAFTRIRELEEYVKNERGGVLDIKLLKHVLKKYNEKPGFLLPEELVAQLHRLTEEG